MEIKDAIISTLAEIDEIVANSEQKSVQQKQIKTVQHKPKPKQVKTVSKQQKKVNTVIRVDEIEYLKSIRERMLVLFEGLQSPQNQNIEDKLELTLNFLEYTLATIDERLNSNT